MARDVVRHITDRNGVTKDIKDTGAVTFEESQSLSAEEKAQARSNIGAGTYSKPSGGIPSSDLAQAVQDLLTAAGTALQSSDLTTLSNKVTALEAYFSSEADADTIINKWNEIVAFLAGIAESQTLDGIINGINTQISGKAAATDLTNHTSNTNNPHSVTKSQVGLGNVGNFKAVSTEANQGLSSTEQGNARTNIGAGTYSKPSGGIPSSDLAQAVQDLLTAAGTALQSSDLTTLSNKVTALEAYFSSEADSDTIINKWNEIVAFLANITESQTLDGIISGINDSISAKYTKPSGGIPASDLASGVQTSLGKADSALQSHQSVSDNNPTLAWGTKSKVGTVGSTELNVTMPANPNTWRPLGTGANDACAGNDSRLSDSRPASDVYSWAKQSSKPSYSYSEINGAPSYAGNIGLGTSPNYITEPEVKSVKINGSSSNAASSSNCVLQFDATNQCLKFVFN